MKQAILIFFIGFQVVEYLIAMIFYVFVIKNQLRIQGNDVNMLVFSAISIIAGRRIFTLVHSPLLTAFPKYPTATSLDTIFSQTIIATLFMIAAIKSYQRL